MSRRYRKNSLFVNIFKSIHFILLKSQLYHQRHVFENDGADFVRPLYFKVNNNDMKKGYILLFTYAVIRTIDPVLTADVGTDSVILLLRRFIKWNENLSHVVSDKLKSFKPTNWKRFLAHQDIKWSFILEQRSPWWGELFKS